MNVDEVLEDFGVWLVSIEGTSGSTANKYVRVVSSVIDRIGDVDSWDEASLTKLQKDDASTLSKSSLNVRLAALRKLFKYLTAEKGYAKDITTHLKFRTPPKRLPRNLTSDEVSGIMDAIAEVGDPQHLALFELLYGSGLRRHEAGGLRLGNFVSKDILRIVGKGDKERLVPLTDAAYLAVRDWLIEHREEDITDDLSPNLYQARCDEIFWTLVEDAPEMSIFYTTASEPVADHVDPGRWVYECMSRYGEFSPHQLRHTWATELLAAGADSMAVKDAGGWESFKVMDGYRQTLKSGILRIKGYHPRQIGG